MIWGDYGVRLGDMGGYGVIVGLYGFYGVLWGQRWDYRWQRAPRRGEWGYGAAMGRYGVVIGIYGVYWALWVLWGAMGSELGLQVAEGAQEG